MTNRTKLSVVFDVLSIKQAQVVRALAAKGIKFSTTSLSRLKTQNEWPKHCKRPEIEQHITEYLRAHGATDDQLSGLFGWDEPEQPNKPDSEEEEMKQKPGLTPATKRHFKIRRDPFVNELSTLDDLFMLDSHHMILEELLAAASASSMIALTGQCGSGKSILRRAFLQRVQEEHPDIIVIEPARIDRKKMTAEAISSAICRELQVKHKTSAEDRDAAIANALIESANSGNRHLLLIDQAQDLTPSLIRLLKCIWEITQGFQRVIGIVLIGQPELDKKLDNNSALREFTWRCHRIRMQPLGIKSIDYMKHKFKRVGLDANKFFTDDALSAIRGKCYGRVGKGIGFDDEDQDMTHPLELQVWLSRAMNQAAMVGAKLIDEKFMQRV